MFETFAGMPEPGESAHAVMEREEIVVGEAKIIEDIGEDYSGLPLDDKPGDVDLCNQPTAKVPYPGVYITQNPTCEVSDAERVAMNFGRYPLMRIPATLVAGK